MKFGVVLVGAALLPWLTGCSDDQTALPERVDPPVKVMQVGEGAEGLIRKLPGTIRAAQQVDLAFQVQGRLIEFPVKEGQTVAEGELLAKLDDRDYRSSLDAINADVRKNRSNLKRAKEMIAKDFISQVEMDRIQVTYDVSIANQQQAQKALADATLVAPFAGTIAKTLVENFQDVQAKQPILSLQNKTELEILVALSETLIVRKEEDSSAVRAYASFAALPEQQFELFVKEFSTEADPKTQTFEYILGIKDIGKFPILPGMTADVTLERVAGGRMRVVAPLTALVRGDGQGTSVWLVDEASKVRLLPVTTGELVGEDSIEILSGLQPGNRIAVAGVSKLVEGMQVQPITDVRY